MGAQTWQQRRCEGQPGSSNKSYNEEYPCEREKVRGWGGEGERARERERERWRERGERAFREGEAWARAAQDRARLSLRKWRRRRRRIRVRQRDHSRLSLICIQEYCRESQWRAPLRRREAGQRLVWRLPGSGQAQCSAPRKETLLLFPPQPIEHFMASARARNDRGGLGGGCEIRRAKTRHNTNCKTRHNTN